MKKAFSVFLALCLCLSLSGAVFASGEASGGASSISYEPAPVFQSGVCVLEPGQTNAVFVVKGRQLWTDSSYEGLGLYDADAPVVIYAGYDAYQDESPADVEASLAPAEDGTDLLLTIPAELDGYTVQSIADKAFYQNTTLERVRLPETAETEKIRFWASLRDF